jgi:hypothetical protein
MRDGKEMNDIRKPESESREPGEYVAPEILTYSPEDFLGLLGPAQGYGGSGPSNPGRSSGGRGYRLYPGLR